MQVNGASRLAFLNCFHRSTRPTVGLLKAMIVTLRTADRHPWASSLSSHIAMAAMLSYICINSLSGHSQPQKPRVWSHD
jgi:hypothetical protein